MLSVDKHCGKSQILQKPCAISNQEATNRKETFSGGRIIYSPWLPGIISLYSAAMFFKDTVPTSSIHGSPLCVSVFSVTACVLCYGQKSSHLSAWESRNHDLLVRPTPFTAFFELLYKTPSLFMFRWLSVGCGGTEHVCVIDLLCYCVFDLVWLYTGMGIVCK